MNPNPRHSLDEGRLAYVNPMIVGTAPKRKDPVEEKLEIDRGEAQVSGPELYKVNAMLI